MKLVSCLAPPFEEGCRSCQVPLASDDTHIPQWMWDHWRQVEKEEKEKKEAKKIIKKEKEKKRG